MDTKQEHTKKPKGAQVGNTQGSDAFDLKSAIRYQLANFERGDIKRGQALKAMMKRTLEDALDGDKAARDYLSDRLEGKPAQTTTLLGDGEKPLFPTTINVIAGRT